jgi:hypothetical protein
VPGWTSEVAEGVDSLASDVVGPEMDGPAVLPADLARKATASGWLLRSETVSLSYEPFPLVKTKEILHDVLSSKLSFSLDEHHLLRGDHHLLPSRTFREMGRWQIILERRKRLCGLPSPLFRLGGFFLRFQPLRLLFIAIIVPLGLR